MRRAIRIPGALRLAAVAIMTLVASGPLANSAQALEIDAELRGELLARGTDSMIDIYVALDAPFDFAALEARIAGGNGSRRALAVQALRDHARESQAAVLSRLADQDLAGRVERMRSLWIANGIALRVESSVVWALADLEVAGTVTRDDPLQMIESLPSADQAVASREDARREAAAAPAEGMRAWSLDWIDAPEVWDLGYDGTGILVAHMDTGVWMQHPDIASRIWNNVDEIAGNGIDDDGNGYVDDVNGYDFGDYDADPSDDGFVVSGGGHGTHTAGTVCGDGTGGIQTGVAPGAELMVCKVAISESGLAPLTSIWESWQYAVENGAHLITMSMGAPGYAPIPLLRTQRQVGDALRISGIVALVASGNVHGYFPILDELSTNARVPSPWHPDPTVPYHSRSGVITVGATSYEADTNWFPSSRGPADWSTVTPYSDWDYAAGDGLIKPDLSAPGEGVNSLNRPSGYTGPTWNGTSMATPHVAGVVALMLQKNPALSPEDVDRILQQTALDLGEPGKDNAFGSGRLNALAAVNAVGAAQLPSVVVQDLQVSDQDGDGYVEPGETFSLDVELYNNSKLVDASSVVLALSTADPYLQVISAQADYGSIAAQASAQNPGQPFSVATLPTTPQGHTLPLVFTVTAAGGYSQTIEYQFVIGLPEFRTHDEGGLLLTVTDRGTLGFWDDNQGDGLGFGEKGGLNGLFIGGVWAGTGPDYLCNRDYVSVDAAEWEVSTVPDGRLAIPPIPIADQHFSGIFTDAGHALPRGLQITQNSLAWNAPADAGFVVLRYDIFNTGQPMYDYYFGLFCDFDILYPLINNAAVDATRNLSYMWDIDGNYYGITLLEPSTTAALALIPNAEFSTAQGFDDETKWDLLTGATNPRNGEPERDYSSLVSAGPLHIPRAQTATVAFALVYGDDLAELQANSDAAHARYASVPTASPPSPIPARTALGQNRPNPFNPATVIRYSVAGADRVQISIFDVRGRHIRRLLDQQVNAGEHAVRWDGADDSGRDVASGVYLYRLSTSDFVETKKMSLVR